MKKIDLENKVMKGDQLIKLIENCMSTLPHERLLIGIVIYRLRKIQEKVLSVNSDPVSPFCSMASSEDKHTEH